MRAIKNKRPKWRKPPMPSRLVTTTTTVEKNGAYHIGDRLVMTTHDGDRLVEVVSVQGGRVVIREVET